MKSSLAIAFVWFMVTGACDFVDQDGHDLDINRLNLPAWTETQFTKPFTLRRHDYRDGIGLRSYESATLVDAKGTKMAIVGRFKKTDKFTIADGRAIEFLEGLDASLRDKINWDKLSYYFHENSGNFSWRVDLNKLYEHFEDDSMRSTYIRLPPKPESSLWDFANTTRPDLSTKAFASLDCLLSPPFSTNEDFYRVGTWKIIDTTSFKKYEINIRDDGRVMTFELN